MPRNMSFMYTIDQMRNKTKTVTRRLGWDHLNVGDTVMACEKCQGIKPGEKLQRIGLIKITGKRKERLYEIDSADCAKEGFPEMLPGEFVEMFCKHMKTYPRKKVNRFEFEHLY